MFDTATLPGSPGCYLFLDRAGTIIYVGKAKNLKKRVASYFQKKDHDPKTRKLVESIVSVSVIVTNTETEAFLLENNLIKKHQPKYNIDLKDAKRYAFIEITREQFPRIGIARRTSKDEGIYFGPFVSAAERDALLKVVKRIFLLRSCRKMPKRACLRHHMHTCSAPCVGAIDEAAYRENTERAGAILRGKGGDLLVTLRAEMAALSDRQEYEKALAIRNQITAIEHLSERQNVEQARETNQDVIAYAVAGESVYLMVFSVEKGKLLGKQEYSFDLREDFFEEFLVQYYSERIPPQELIVPHEIDPAIAEFLSEKKGRSVAVTVPQIGEKKKLLSLVVKNIEHAFLKNELKGTDLRTSLGLAGIPEVIECFDISHISGTAMVGSMVQFRGGAPDKKNYRRFKIKTVEGIDDFASIAEVVTRRYRRLIEEDGDLPDLILIDGGKGQLGAAVSALDALGVAVPVIAIAKREEDIYVPGEALPRKLDPKGMALHYLQEIRNEAHRFAIAYNRLLRKKKLLK